MSDTEPVPKSGGVKRYSRRAVIKTPVKAALLSVLTAIGCKPPTSSEQSQQQPPPQLAQQPVGLPEQPASNPPPNEPKEEVIDISRMEEFIDNGRKIRTEDDLDMLNNTIPGIDLTYNLNPRIQAIREITDPTERIMTAIGFLGVKEVDRYDIDIQNKYVCNIYALDLLRLLLGNKDIGSRYNRNTGAPSPLGLYDIDRTDQAKLDAYDADNPFLDSNNFDKWMRENGAKYGWRKVNSQEELKRELAGGKAIAVGVTKDEIVKKERQERERRREEGEEDVEDYAGHMFVVVDAGGNGFGETQATDNYSLRGFSYKSDKSLVKPGESEYNFYVHDNTPPVSP